ncbi:putative acyl-CoA dehydrogenase [compost metagenome]
MAGAQAVQKYQLKLEQEQEILSHLADMMIAIYAMESALLRSKKQLHVSSAEKAELSVVMTTVFIDEQFDFVQKLAREVFNSMNSGDTLRTQLSILKKLAKRSPVNTMELKRQLAKKLIDSEQYVV